MRSGWNRSKSASFSPVEAKAIGRPTTSLTREGRTAAGVAVELGQDHPVELERLRGTPTPSPRRPGRSWRRRPGTCSAARPPRRPGGPRPSAPASMARRPAVSTISTSRPSRRASSQPVLRRPTTGSVGSLNTLHPGLLAEHPQLLHGRGPLEVGPDEQRVAPLLLPPLGELGRGGGLARALEAGQQHDRGRPRGVGQLSVSPPEHRDQLLVDDLDHLLAGSQALGQGLPGARAPGPGPRSAGPRRARRRPRGGRYGSRGGPRRRPPRSVARGRAGARRCARAGRRVRRT